MSLDLLMSALLLAALVTEPETPSSGQEKPAIDIPAGRICGADARNNEMLLAELRAKPGIQVMQEDDGFVQLMDAAEGVVWAFTVKDHPGYPAVSCNELGPYQGRLVFRQSMLCNGASEVDCQAFYLINARRNVLMAAEIEARRNERQ